MKRVLIIGVLLCTVPLTTNCANAKNKQKGKTTRATKAAALTIAQQHDASAALAQLRGLKIAVDAGLNIADFSKRFIDTKVAALPLINSLPQSKSKQGLTESMNVYQDTYTLWHAFFDKDGDTMDVVLHRYFADVQQFGLDANGETTPVPALVKIWAIANQKTERAAQNIAKRE